MIRSEYVRRGAGEDEILAGVRPSDAGDRVGNLREFTSAGRGADPD
jgi:hypothetical protein